MHKYTKYLSWIFISLVVFSFFVRLHRISVPLIQDEGEYAYMGQLMREGIPPYKESYNMKLPGVYLLYAFSMSVFGETSSGVHLGLLFFNMITCLIIYFIGKKISGHLSGIASASLYALLSLHPSVNGLSANAEHFVMTFALLGFLSLLYIKDKKKVLHVFVSGFAMGLAFIMKQHALAFVLCGFLYILYLNYIDKSKYFIYLKDSTIYMLGAVLPYMFVCIWMWYVGVFENFYFWTFKYAREYASIVQNTNSVGDSMQIFLYQIINMMPDFLPVFLFSLIGLVILYKKERNKKYRFLVILFFISSFLSTVPGFYFRNHYFIFIIPILSIICIYSFDFIYKYIYINSDNRKAFLFGIGFVFIIISFCLFSQFNIYVRGSDSLVLRSNYSPNPFSASVVVGDYIKDHTSKNDTLAVIGSEPQIYFYAQRHNASGYLYTYPLTESQLYATQMQNEMINQIENNKPKYIVFIHDPMSWLITPLSNKHIFQWYEGYTHKYYKKVGIVDIRKDETKYYWDSDVQKYTDDLRTGMLIYERK